MENWLNSVTWQGLPPGSITKTESVPASTPICVTLMLAALQFLAAAWKHASAPGSADSSCVLPSRPCVTAEPQVACGRSVWRSWAHEFHAPPGQVLGEEPGGDVSASGRDQPALRTESDRPRGDVGTLAADTEVGGRGRVGVLRQRPGHTDDEI